MTDTPEDWVLIEAARRCGRDHWSIDDLITFMPDPSVFNALCDMIAKHEQPPVDRKLLCAREACREARYGTESHIATAMVHAITLWEEGFGK